jgi:hypothetical protein
VGLVEPLADVTEEVLVAVDLGQGVLVVEVYQLSVETARREREEGVEKDEARLREVDRCVAVHVSLVLEGHRTGAVSGAHHVTEAVGLDDIAEISVDHQPANDQVRVELEVLDRPAVGDEELLEPVVDPLLPDLGVVVDQGVVHVVTDGPDRPQVEGAVRVDLPPGRHLFETQCRFHHRRECSSDIIPCPSPSSFPCPNMTVTPTAICDNMPFRACIRSPTQR